MAQLDHLYDTVVKSGLPMERYGELIFSLGKEFADVGIDVMDAAGALGSFEEATTKGYMTMGLAMKMGRLAMNQQLTAGGFQGRVLTAAFAQDMWSKVDKDTRGELDRAAAKTYGKGVGFRDIDAYEASNLLANLESVSPGLYVKAMEGSFRKLMEIEKESGWGAAEQTAQAIGIPQWREFRKIGPTLAEGAVSPEKLREIMMTADERMLEASKKMLLAAGGMTTASELGEENAKLNQQWYSEWRALWTHITGLIVKALGGETLGDIAEGITAQTIGQTITGPATLPMIWALKQTGLWQEAVESPKVEESRKLREEWGISPEQLWKYERPGGLKEQGKPLEYREGELDLELMKGKGIQIKVLLVDTPTGETVGGTPLGQ